ncbi:BQ2448_7367 [Microbotryum intermedium]|uniref:BQ2448_7367 protein n=1 Tax=Microbotryum intermedium TaxID=269621 RepID=A0A238FMR1_9BASI|nr:BQ2448_7367 [Microbotryum intermedium]
MLARRTVVEAKAWAQASTSSVLATFNTTLETETANGTRPDWTFPSHPSDGTSSPFDDLNPIPRAATRAHCVNTVSAPPPSTPPPAINRDAPPSNHPSGQEVLPLKSRQATAALLEHIRRHRSERALPSILPIFEDTTDSDLNHPPGAHSQDHSQTNGAPTPPPPIAYLPHSSSENPHLLTAFLLQAIFLGASALGLLVRKTSTVQRIDDSSKSKSAPTSVSKRAEADLASRKQRRTEEIDNVPALNLLLSSYVELSEPEVKVAPSTKETVVSSFVTRKMERMPHVVEVLSRFSEARARPDSWTTLAVMAFVEVPSKVVWECLSGSPETKDRFGELNALSDKLVEWAWQAFVGTPENGMSPEVKATLVSSFLQWAARTEVVEEGNTTALAHRVIDHFSSSRPELTVAQRALLGQAALRHSRTDLVAQLLAADSALDPRARVDLAASTLTVLADHDEWHRRGDVVLYTAEAFVTSLEQHWASSSDADASRAIDATLRATLDRCLTLLLHRFRIDAPLEPFYARIVELVMVRDPTSFTSSRLRFILDALISARQAKLATKVFLLIPASSRTLPQYESMLHSHRAMTSDRVWSDLLNHPTFVPTVGSLSARLSSHLLTRRPQLAIHDFDLIRQRLNTKTLQILSESDRLKWTKCYSKLYTLYVRTKHDVSLSRLRRRMKDDLGHEAEKTDVSMGVGLLLRDVLGRPWDLGEARRGRLKGRKQVERVGKTWRWIEQSAVGRKMTRVEEAEGGVGVGVGAVSRGILNNVGLKGLVKWNCVVDASGIERIAEKVLGAEDEMGLDKVGVMREDEFEKVRKVAYKILMRALEERGARDQCTRLRKRLEEEIGERRRVRRRGVRV